MTTYLAAGFCCCLDCCCRDIVDALRKLMGPERVTKIFYIFLVIGFVVPAILIFFFLHNWQAFIDYFSQYISCPESSGGGTFQCIGASAVYRLSLSVLILFILMMLIMVCRNRCAMIVNEGLFFVKYLFAVGLFIAFLWVPNDTFMDYAEASKGISIVFMVLQAIILIDLFYMAGIRMVKHYDEGQGQYACYLVTLSTLAEAVAIALNIYGYIEFDDRGALCSSSTIWVNVLTSIVIIGLPILQYFNFNVQNSLLTTALVSMYVSYLSFMAQFSYVGENETCLKMTQQSLIVDVIVSTFFFILTMYGSIKGGSGQVKVTENGDINRAMGVAPTTERNSPEDENTQSLNQNSSREQEKIKEEGEATYYGWTWVKWHFYMCLSAIYIGMLITNWGSASIISGELEASSFGFWVRICMSWVTVLLYIWTLVAPKVFPDRDFVVE